MGFYYNAPKNGSKYANLNGFKWEEFNSRIEFSELAFCNNDEFYFIFAYANKVFDVVKAQDNFWKFEPQLVSFKIARKDYQKWDGKEKKNVVAIQSRVEKWACSVFKNLNPEVVYTGFLTLQDSSQLDVLITEIDGAGQPIDPLALKWMQQSYSSFTPIVTPQHVFLEDVKAPESGIGWGGRGSNVKAQGELEKLNDRLNFVCNQVNLVDSSLNVSNFLELSKLMDEHPQKAKIVEIVGWCTDLMK